MYRWGHPAPCSWSLAWRLSTGPCHRTPEPALVVATVAAVLIAQAPIPGRNRGERGWEPQPEAWLKAWQ